MKKKKYYLHTIDTKNQPGGFNGEQICFGGHGLTLVKTLKQIRLEQKKSQAFRGKNGFRAYEYGYLLVYLPD